MTTLVFCFYAHQVSILGISEDFTLATLGIICVLVFYAVYGSRQDDLPLKKQDPLYLPGFLITLLAALGFIAYVGGWGLCRALSFGASTYDLGIFAQMFHSMKTSGLPMTTLERGYLLSHFAVHVSPIYYLLLPFYCLAPGAHTLNLLQAVLLGSSIIPLWKLCRSHGLRSTESVLICLALLFAPALSGGTSYDFHKNAFLTPLILWLFYAIRKNSTPPYYPVFSFNTVCQGRFCGLCCGDGIMAVYRQPSAGQGAPLLGNCDWRRNDTFLCRLFSWHYRLSCQLWRRRYD